MTAHTDHLSGANRLVSTNLAAEPVFLMARVASIGSSGANRLLSELELKVRHYSVLALACSGKEPTQRELSEFLVLDPSQIVAIIDELEKRGAVERRADPRDRRSKIIVPTPAGQDLYAQAKEVVDASTAQSLAALSSAQREQLSRLLGRVAFRSLSTRADSS